MMDFFRRNIWWSWKKVVISHRVFHGIRFKVRGLVVVRQLIFSFFWGVVGGGNFVWLIMIYKIYKAYMIYKIYKAYMIYKVAGVFVGIFWGKVWRGWGFSLILRYDTHSDSFNSYADLFSSDFGCCGGFFGGCDACCCSESQGCGFQADRYGASWQADTH
ncbi:MAG: hypothetical protein J6L73_00540 [Muribaculaceae bacterium]|nr:hypothetical protein [Muribaculaceae bacterium]